MSAQVSEHYATVHFGTNTHVSAHITYYIDCEVEQACFNSDGTFLVVGDRKGTLHFIHTQSRAVIFSQALIKSTDDTNSDQMFQRIQFLSQHSGPEELFVLLAGAKMMRFANIDFVLLKQALSTGSKVDALAVKNNSRVEDVDLGALALSEGEHVSDIEPTLVPSTMETEVVVTAKSAVALSRWMKRDEKTQIGDRLGAWVSKSGLMRVRISPDGRYLIAIDAKGVLSLWDFGRLLLLRTFKQHSIKQFVILPNGMTGLQNSHSLHLATLGGGLSDMKVRILQLPSFEVVYEVSVDPTCALVECAPTRGTLAEESRIYFIERDDSEIFVRTLNETVPAKRFHDLVEKKMYAEAESLAEKFGLDVEVIMKARARHFIAQEVTDCAELVRILSQAKVLNRSLSLFSTLL